MRPAYALLLLASTLLATIPSLALAQDAPPRFDVEVRITGGDVVLRVDLCGHGPGSIDLLGVDLGDPENAPLALQATTDTHACAGDGFLYRDVLAEGAISPPFHCYHLQAIFTGAAHQVRAADADCG